METPTLVLAMGFGSAWHWIILLLVALLLFGRRLPSIMRGLGGSIKEFKAGIDDGEAGMSKLKQDIDPTRPLEKTAHKETATERHSA